MSYLAPDKIKHALVGLLLSLAYFIHPGLGVALPVIAGWLKEAWDRRGHGTYDPKDAWVTAFAGWLGCVGWALWLR